MALLTLKNIKVFLHNGMVIIERDIPHTMKLPLAITLHGRTYFQEPNGYCDSTHYFASLDLDERQPDYCG